jgi:23S rRNA (cytidine1920-2'-O)/16S rRNA (cytidine1409-2'-O)-methyltransferase
MKNGVVKDPKIHKEVVKMLVNYVNDLGLYVNDLTYSTQKGKTGNIEYLALISKNPIINKYNIDKVVEDSHKM